MLHNKSNVAVSPASVGSPLGRTGQGVSDRQSSGKGLRGSPSSSNSRLNSRLNGQVRRISPIQSYVCNERRPRSHKQIGNHAGTGPISRLLALRTNQFSCDNLPMIKRALKHLESIREDLFSNEYNEMRKSLIKKADSRLMTANLSQCEPVTSSLYPKQCLEAVENFQPVDKAYMKTLINSARIQECKLPDFDTITKAPNSSHSDVTAADEFQFEVAFTFGFSLDVIKQSVYNGCRSWQVPLPINDIIAEYVGDSYFKVKLTVYFDKSKPEWNEQDGEAWIWIHDGPKQNIEKDVVFFDKSERIYYVENWPLKGLVLGDYSDSQESEEKLERRMAAWLCSQIMWFTLGPNLNPNKCHCMAVRNMMRKLLFVLKGWFTGLLLGEPFEPAHVRFETEFGSTPNDQYLHEILV